MVAPNPIDMDKVFKELSRLDETGNFGVLLTIIFVFFMYIVAIVLAIRADRKDQTKVGISSTSPSLSLHNHLNYPLTVSEHKYFLRPKIAISLYAEPRQFHVFQVQGIF